MHSLFNGPQILMLSCPILSGYVTHLIRLHIIPFLFSRKTKPSDRKHPNLEQDWKNVLQSKGIYPLYKLVVSLYTLQILIRIKAHLILLLQIYSTLYIITRPNMYSILCLILKLLKIIQINLQYFSWILISHHSHFLLNDTFFKKRKLNFRAVLTSRSPSSLMRGTFLVHK
jgi:hypothetical protein